MAFARNVDIKRIKIITINKRQVKTLDSVWPVKGGTLFLYLIRAVWIRGKTCPMLKSSKEMKESSKNEKNCGIEMTD